MAALSEHGITIKDLAELVALGGIIWRGATWKARVDYDLANIGEKIGTEKGKDLAPKLREKRKTQGKPIGWKPVTKENEMEAQAPKSKVVELLLKYKKTVIGLLVTGLLALLHAVSDVPVEELKADIHEATKPAVTAPAEAPKVVTVPESPKPLEER